MIYAYCRVSTHIDALGNAMIFAILNSRNKGNINVSARLSNVTDVFGAESTMLTADENVIKSAILINLGKSCVISFKEHSGIDLFFVSQFFL